VPPRHWKSVIFSIAIPLYELVCDRSKRIIIISRTSDLAVGFVRNIAGVLGEARIERDFGRYKPVFKGQTQWSEGVGSLQVLGGSEYSVKARGSSTQILGLGADLIVADDPTDIDIARSPLEREREFQRFQAEALTRGSVAAKAVVVGQRVGSIDFYSMVADLLNEDTGEPLFHVERHPAVLQWPEKDEDDRWLPETARVLAPELWPWSELAKKLNLLGASRFSTMYQQSPRPDGGGLMPVETFAKARDDRPAWRGRREVAARAVEAEGVGRQNPYVRVLSVDPSPTNYHGITVADVAVDGAGNTDTWVLGCTRLKARAEGGLEHFLTTVDTYARKFRVDFLLIEESTFAVWMRESAWWSRIFDRSDAPRYLRQTTTSKNKNSVEFGLASLEADFELGRMHLPYGDAEARGMTDLLEEEVTQYEPGSGKGGLDDILMSLWFIKAQAKRLKVQRPKSSHFDGTRAQPHQSWVRAKKDEPRSVEDWREVQRKEREAEENWQSYIEEPATPEEQEGAA
jgi:hypothetical protein